MINYKDTYEGTLFQKVFDKLKFTHHVVQNLQNVLLLSLMILIM